MRTRRKAFKKHVTAADLKALMIAHRSTCPAFKNFHATDVNVTLTFLLSFSTLKSKTTGMNAGHLALTTGRSSSVRGLTHVEAPEDTLRKVCKDLERVLGIPVEFVDLKKGGGKMPEEKNIVPDKQNNRFIVQKDEKPAAEQTKEKTKKTAKSQKSKEESKQPAEPQFPLKAKVNAYGFLHFSTEMREAFGIPLGKKVPETRVSVDFKDGKLIISKA